MSKIKDLAFIILVLAIYSTLIFFWSGRTRAIEGIWLAQFEGSSFHENATPADLGNLDELGGSWLSLDLRNYMHPPYSDKTRGCFSVQAFTISFVGRKSYGLSGHLGGWLSSFEVDRVISIKPLAYPICGKNHEDSYSAG